MKKVKMLLLGLVTMLALAVMTGCGVEDPTEKEVRKVLLKCGAIPEDADSDEYTVVIDKVKLKSDNKKAQVSCTLKYTGKNGTVETGYTLNMRLSDSKKWGIKASRLEKDVEIGEQVLTSEVSEEALKEAITDYGAIIIGENIYASADDFISSMKLGNHTLDGKELTDTVTISGTCQPDVYAVTYSVDLTVKYRESTDRWIIYAAEVKSSEKELMLKTLSDEDTITLMTESSYSMYLEDPYFETVYLKDLADIKIISHDFDTDNLIDKVRLSAKYTNSDKAVYSIEAEAMLAYNPHDEEWNISRISPIMENISKEMPENYNLVMDEASVNAFLMQSPYSTVTVLGNTFSFSKEEIAIVKIEKADMPELNGQVEVEIPLVMVAKNDFMETTIDCTVTLKYDYTNGWKFYTWSGNITNVVTALTGEWKGNASEEGIPMTMVVLSQPDENYNNNIPVDITNEATNETVRYYVVSFAKDTKEVYLQSADEHTFSFGTIDGNVWTVDENSVFTRK